jgi:hypothetical protein
MGNRAAAVTSAKKSSFSMSSDIQHCKCMSYTPRGGRQLTWSSCFSPPMSVWLHYAKYGDALSEFVSTLPFDHRQQVAIPPPFATKAKHCLEEMKWRT